MSRAALGPIVFIVMGACGGTPDRSDQATVVHLDVQNQDISRGPASIVVRLDEEIIFDRIVQPFESPSPKVDVPLGPGAHVVRATASGAESAEVNVSLDAKRWIVVDLWPVNSYVDHPQLGINRYDGPLPR